jgi:hypothetical protein
MKLCAVTRGGIMQRRHCEDGDKLDNLYTQNTLVWGVAETRKRAAACVASKGEWFKIARRAEEAKTAYEKAKCNYLDHVIACPLCDAHVLAPPSVRRSYLLLSEYSRRSSATQ